MGPPPGGPHALRSVRRKLRLEGRCDACAGATLHAYRTRPWAEAGELYAHLVGSCRHIRDGKRRPANRVAVEEHLRPTVRQHFDYARFIRRGCCRGSRRSSARNPSSSCRRRRRWNGRRVRIGLRSRRGHACLAWQLRQRRGARECWRIAWRRDHERRRGGGCGGDDAIREPVPRCESPHQSSQDRNRSDKPHPHVLGRRPLDD